MLAVVGSLYAPFVFELSIRGTQGVPLHWAVRSSGSCTFNGSCKSGSAFVPALVAQVIADVELVMFVPTELPHGEPHTLGSALKVVLL